MAQFNTDTQEFHRNNDKLFESMILSDDYGNPVNSLYPLITQVADGTQLTPLGHQRVSNLRMLGENFNLFGAAADTNMNYSTNGGSVTQNYTNNATVLSVTTASGSKAVRSSRQYHPYTAGCPSILYIGFTLNEPKANLNQSAGFFDDESGLFFRMKGTSPQFVVRRSFVDTFEVNQADWNIDKFDGTGPSRKTIDFSKSLLLVIDYLYTGRVRYGFFVDGVLHYAHQWNYKDIAINGTYISIACLPARTELLNTGVTASASTMIQTIYAAFSEGSDFDVSYSRSISNYNFPTTIDSTTDGTLMLAVKLANATNNGRQNRAIMRLKEWQLISNVDMRYRVVIFNDESKIVSPTWTQVPGYSWSQYTYNKAMVAGWDTTANFGVLTDAFVPGSSGNNRGSTSFQIDNKINSLYQNYDSTQSQVLAVIGYKCSSNASAYASITYAEVR